MGATGLTRPAHFFDDDRLRDNFNHGAINLMKGGIVYSNFITTVSPEHAWRRPAPILGDGPGADALPPPGQVRRRAQRHRLRRLESGDRHPDPVDNTAGR